MKNMRNWMLGAAVVAGGLGLAAAPAQAAEFGIYARGPVAYVPPCPGPGYVWTAGYYANGYWVPGYWNRPAGHFRGPVVRGYVGFGPDRHFDRPLDRGHFRR